MGLTGVSLIALTLLATAAAIAATTLFWGRPGRWRPVGRSAGVLLCETLVVLSAGLIANRHEQFYPSWQALIGDTGTTTTTAGQPAGRLDDEFGPATPTVAWQPPGSAAWHLASRAQVTVPPGYLGSHVSYPALVALGGRPASGGLVRVTALPTARTQPAGAANPASGIALADLPALLGADVRVTRHGWAVVASAAFAPLAARLVEDNPGRFSALAVVGGPPRGFRCPPGVPVAVARTAPARGTLPRGVVALKGAWSVAAGWALTLTPLPLAAPEVLPTAAVR